MIIFYILLQLWVDIPVLLKMVINNFYIRKNVLTQDDIEAKEYELKEIKNIKNDKHLVYRYYLINTLVITGVTYFIDKKYNDSSIKDKIVKFFTKK